VLVAGGIGITPLLPMAAAAAASGAEWTLTYGGRSRASMAFTRELTEAYGDRVRLRPQDEFGLLDLDSLLGTPDANTLVYCCGPAPLLDAAEQRCAGWPAGALRVERFTPKELGSPRRDLPFEVELTRSRKTLTVERGRSILDVVRESGVQVLSSCQEGTCGTCETEVLDGEVDHRDSLLSAEEQAANDTMMICVSRAAGTKLVLAI
jgi:ferredoxin-NADP reductase